jgi:hypothetical protein
MLRNALRKQQNTTRLFRRVASTEVVHEITSFITLTIVSNFVLVS